MPIEIAWYLENRIIINEYHGTIRLDDINAAVEKSILMLENTSASTVHALHDVKYLKALPMNVHGIYMAAKDAYTHPRVGWIVSYHLNNPFFKFVGNTMTQLTGAKYRTVPTQADALAWLQSRDTTLLPLLKNVTQPLPPLE